jgi:hypothetical protein
VPFSLGLALGARLSGCDARALDGMPRYRLAALHALAAGLLAYCTGQRERDERDWVVVLVVFEFGLFSFACFDVLLF